MAWGLVAPAFAHDVFTRQNFRGRDLPTAAGAVIVLVVLVVNAVLVVIEVGGAEQEAAVSTSMRLVLVASLGFSLLGLLDDLGGTGESGGFVGHLRSLTLGRLTTGGIKLFGGAAVAIVVVGDQVSPVGPGTGTDTWWADIARLLADAALVALAANLANLFDRAPGRVIKVSLVAFVLLVIGVGAEPQLAGIALVVGSSVGLLLADLRERLMLGDTGANVLGAALGLGVVLTCSPGVRTAVLVVVAALNLISERVSFTRVINSVPPLRALDRFGRLP